MSSKFALLGSVSLEIRLHRIDYIFVCVAIPSAVYLQVFPKDCNPLPQPINGMSPQVQIMGQSAMTNAVPSARIHAHSIEGKHYDSQDAQPEGQGSNKCLLNAHSKDDIDSDSSDSDGLYDILPAAKTTTSSTTIDNDTRE
eukprot:612116_1